MMRLACGLIWCLLAGSAVLAAEQNLISNPDFTEGTRGWTLQGQEACTVTPIPVTGGPRATALRLGLQPPAGASSWQIQLMAPVDGFVSEGNTLRVRLYHRSPDAAKAIVYLQQGRDPWAKSVRGELNSGTEWQQATFTGQAGQSFGPREMQFAMHLALGPGTLELTGIEVVNMNAADAPRRANADNPLPLVVNGDFAQPLGDIWTTTGGAGLKLERFESDAPGFQYAVRAKVNPPVGGAAWSVGWGQVVQETVFEHDAIFARAWMRSPDSASATFVYELNEAPHTKTISQQIKLTPEWREYRFMGRARQTFRPGESVFKWHLGHQVGTIEIAGLRVENYGNAPDDMFSQTIDWWGGRPHSDDWRAEALARIEQIRKGELVVKVVDAAGRPVPDAAITVEQTRHRFRFGTAAPAGRFLDQANPDNLRFQAEVARLFNTVTFENDLKWASSGPGRLDLVDQAIDWLNERGIDARGHCLLWGSNRYLPSQFRELPADQLLAVMKSHVAEYTARMRGRVYLWDVVNEARNNTEVWDKVGWEEFANSFRWARAGDPEALLAYNDYAIVSDYTGNQRAGAAAKVRYLIEQEAPLDVLGIQCHMGVPLVPIDVALRSMDEWAAFGKRLEVTEYDLGCFDDEVHGAYFRDFLTATFSHPAMDAFIMWGFWRGSHWRAKDGAGLYTLDWTARPALRAYEELVFGDWWTNWTGRGDAAGSAEVRAFLGRHKLTATAGGRTGEATVELTGQNRPEVTITLR